jgi:hypothetical protein
MYAYAVGKISNDLQGFALWLLNGGQWRTKPCLRVGRIGEVGVWKNSPSSKPAAALLMLHKFEEA